MATADRFRTRGSTVVRAGVTMARGFDAETRAPVLIYDFDDPPPSAAEDFASPFTLPLLWLGSLDGAYRAVARLPESYGLAGDEPEGISSEQLLAAVRALQSAAAAGLVHGDLGPARFLLAEDRLYLEGFGVPWLPGPGIHTAPDAADRPSAAGDVWALAASVRSIGLADEDDTLEAILEQCLDPDPAGRPSADELYLALASLLPGAADRLERTEREWREEDSPDTAPPRVRSSQSSPSPPADHDYTDSHTPEFESAPPDHHATRQEPASPAEQSTPSPHESFGGASDSGPAGEPTAERSAVPPAVPGTSVGRAHHGPEDANRGRPEQAGRAVPEETRLGGSEQPAAAPLHPRVPEEWPQGNEAEDSWTRSAPERAAEERWSGRAHWSAPADPRPPARRTGPSGGDGHDGAGEGRDAARRRLALVGVLMSAIVILALLAVFGPPAVRNVAPIAQEATVYVVDVQVNPEDMPPVTIHLVSAPEGSSLERGDRLGTAPRHLALDRPGTWAFQGSFQDRRSEVVEIEVPAQRSLTLVIPE